MLSSSLASYKLNSMGFGDWNRKLNQTHFLWTLKFLFCLLTRPWSRWIWKLNLYSILRFFSTSMVASVWIVKLIPRHFKLNSIIPNIERKMTSLHYFHLGMLNIAICVCNEYLCSISGKYVEVLCTKGQRKSINCGIYRIPSFSMHYFCQLHISLRFIGVSTIPFFQNPLVFFDSFCLHLHMLMNGNA